MKTIKTTKKEFKKMYFTMTNADIAEMFHLSVPTVIKIARTFGYEKGKGYHQKVHIRC